MKITKPTTPERIRAEQDIKKGPHFCTCTRADETTTQQGFPMLRLQQRIETEDGEILGMIVDRVAESIDHGAKAYSLATAYNMLTEYQAGELKAADIVGKRACCEVVVKRKYGSQIVSYMPLPREDV